MKAIARQSLLPLIDCRSEKWYGPSSRDHTFFGKATGKVHARVTFQTYSLPCFKELHELFYSLGKKIVPANIGDLLTPLGLAYWICDDGSFHKSRQSVTLCTNSFTLEEVTLLAKTLNDKWDLKCAVHKSRDGFVIYISSKSLSILQNLLKDTMVFSSSTGCG